MSANSSPIQGPYSGTGSIICCSIFIVVCTFVVGLRLHARSYTKSGWGWDDCLLVPSLFFSLAVFSFFIYMAICLGGGYHVEDVLASDPSKLVLFAKVEVGASLCLVLSLSLPRIAMFIFFLRIITNPLSRKIAWGLIGLIIVWTAIIFIINLVICIPLDALWDPTIQAKCIDKDAWWPYSTIPYAVFDLATMIFPVPIILQLHRPLNERLALLFTFLACGFGTIAEVARIVLFKYIDVNQDPTWAFVPVCYVTCCEVGIYLIAASIPGLRPLWLHYHRKGALARRSSSQFISLEARKRSHDMLSGPRTDDSRYRLNTSKDLTSSNVTEIEGLHDSPTLPSGSLRPNEIMVTQDYEIV